MTEKLIHGVFRRVNRGRVRDLLTGKIHQSFTVAADQLFQRGYMNEKERIALSGVIGDVLPKFQEGIDDAVGNRPVDTDDLRAIAEKSLILRTHSRTKCMQCDSKPTIACHWANGHGMAWFCRTHFKEWLGEDDRDVCGVWVLEEGECPEDIRKTPKGTNKVRKLGEDISPKEIYSRIDEIVKRGGLGSGHRGHRGVRGQTGGSLPRAKGTNLGGLGVPDMKDASKSSFVSQRIMQVNDETVVALVSLRRLDVFKTKPYRLESRWYVKDRKGPATQEQQDTGADLLEQLETSTIQIMEISGWARSTYRDNLWVAPWRNALHFPVELVTRPYSNVPEDKWGAMDDCVEKVMAKGKTKERAIAICYSSIVEREFDDFISEDDLLQSEVEDEPVGLATETETKEDPEQEITEEVAEPADSTEEDVEQESTAISVEETPEQKITGVVEGPAADDTTRIIEDEISIEGPLLKEEGKVIDRAKGIFRRVRRTIERHFGPGTHPGTGTSQEVHGKGGGGVTSVGVTSARPGKASGQVFEEMRGFASQLNEIPTIKNVSVSPGLGGWEGGRESTWVVTYDGNGDAMRLIARTAMEHEQEGVLFTREGGDDPVSTFAFSDPVRPNERDEVNNVLGEVGIGGWQWFRLPGGQPTLRIVNVPQWGGDAETHRQSMKKLTQMFDALEMPHEFKEEIKKVDILEKEGSYGYNTILEG